MSGQPNSHCIVGTTANARSRNADSLLPTLDPIGRIKRRTALWAYVAILTMMQFVLSEDARADCGGGSCLDVEITDFYVDANGLFIMTSGDETLLDCTFPGQENLIQLKTSHANYDAVYSALLTFYIQGTNVNVIRILNGSNPCEIAYVRDRL